MRDISCSRTSIIFLLTTLGMTGSFLIYVLKVPYDRSEYNNGNALLFPINPRLYPPQLSQEEIIQMKQVLAASQEQKIDHRNTAAVIFHFRFIKPESMPNRTQRRPDQLYVWKTGEAPPSLLYMSKKSLEYEDRYGFNATFSFRRDSDVRVPYGSTLRTHLRTKKLRQQNNPLANKTRLAIAVVSNCDQVPGAELRIDILKNISKAGLNIDLLGRCFENETSVLKNDTRAFRSLLRQYKFYFSFENSYHCRDYVTEKLFQNAYESGSIPVVWGPTKEDLEDIAPPASYIFLEDFSYKELVYYLNYLDQNDTAYLEYFRWYTMDETKMSGYGQATPHCQLCRIVHGINVGDLLSSEDPQRPLFSDRTSKRQIKSLSDWYFATENEECKLNATELRQYLQTERRLTHGQRHDENFTS